MPDVRSRPHMHKHHGHTHDLSGYSAERHHRCLLRAGHDVLYSNGCYRSWLRSECNVTSVNDYRCFRITFWIGIYVE